LENGPPQHTNRLAQETSPYLLQHAHNPVDWYAWGPEAFEAARRQDKPIFLSVGYSTCYWCHVMERECFENPAIAAEMNRRCINIKVDREERPDVDQLYMTFVQVLTRQGGWPMSVFLTPQLKPFYGGTYFPPQDRYNRPGFPQLLAAIDQAYHARKDEVIRQSDHFVHVLSRIAEPPAPEAPIAINDAFIETLIDRSTADYDPDHGGFGSAPKFPRQTLLELLLVQLRHHPNEQRSKMILHTLEALARGGIRDHLGGAFHRYSTDAEWLVPHFEIMLYDNAMLAWIYTEAYAQTEDLRYAKVARGILDFVLREMTSPQGAFYTAFDAEVHAREGASYLWTMEEIEQILGEDNARLFGRVYGLDLGPNFADPHHGSGAPDANILLLPRPLEDAAAEFKMDVARLEARLEPMRQKLYSARLKRDQPLLDTKILTSWNALMIRAFAHAGSVLQDKTYLKAAGAGADFLLAHHRAPDGGLYRTSRDGGAAKYPGFLDDYAFLCQALLALADAGGNMKRQEQAGALATLTLAKFGDPSGAGGFYFTAADAQDLIVRQKTIADSPLPSGNAVAAMVLMELGKADVARDIIAAFAQQVHDQGESASAMVQAMMHYVRDYSPITVSAEGEPAATAATGSEIERPTSPKQTAAGVVTLSTSWRQPDLLEVAVEILDGFHINAHVASAGLLATQLAVSREAAELVADIDYPPGEERSFSFSPTKVRVYSGRISIAVRFKQAPTGQVSLSLYYQACNDQACLPPVTKSCSTGGPPVSG
jgi:uncharacterized protein YyaL (SSP411 family)